MSPHPYDILVCSSALGCGGLASAAPCSVPVDAACDAPLSVTAKTCSRGLPEPAVAGECEPFGVERDAPLAGSGRLSQRERIASPGL